MDVVTTGSLERTWQSRNQELFLSGSSASDSMLGATDNVECTHCRSPLGEGGQGVLGREGGVVSRKGRVPPCMVDRGQQKNRGVKECGWLVCSWFPSLNEAADRGVIR